jgi:hypothetical protein
VPLSTRAAIVNIDRLASRIVNDTTTAAKRRVINEDDALNRWRTDPHCRQNRM